MGRVTETAPWTRPSGAELKLQEALAVVFRLDRLTLIGLHAIVANEIGESGPTEEHVDGRRRVALAMMRLAADHLGLGPDERLSVAKYRRVQSELGLIDSNRVISAFGSWTFAQQAFGRSAAWAARSRRLKGKVRGHPRGRVEPLEALRLWLTQEERPTIARYERFRRERNATIAPDECLLPSSQWIKHVLGCSFAAAIAVARGGELPTVAKADALGPVDLRELVAQGEVDGLARPYGFDKHIVEADRFPNPAKLLDNRRAWLKRDVHDFLEHGAAAKREPFWLAQEILDANELATAVEVGRMSVRQCEVPPPYGKAGGRRYWWKADVDRWLADHQGVIARRRGGGAGRARRERRAPTTLEVGLVSESELEHLAARRGPLGQEGLPTRVLCLARGPAELAYYWRADVEVWLRGESPPMRERDELNAQVQTSVEIVKTLGLPAWRLKVKHRKEIGFPEPAGRVGSFALWWCADVAAWAERRASEER